MNILEKYNFCHDAEAMNRTIADIEAGLDGRMDPVVLKKCFSLMDLTSLHPQDTVDSVKKLVALTNGVREQFPGYPLPASICVFPNFASVVRDNRNDPELHVTTVAACFPASQSWLSVKELECRMAVREGADEVDIVLALNSFLAGDYKTASGEIAVIRKAVDEEGAAHGRKVVLKVILETGVLCKPELIAAASFLAMEAGADFIKTSTGKVSENATPVSAYIMCECIASYYKATGRKVGFKAAGGISSAKDALEYYCIVDAILGEDWLNKDLFRFGVSRLGNSLVSAIESKTVNYF